MAISAFLGATLLLGVVAASPFIPNKPLPPTPPKEGYVSPFENVTAPVCTTKDEIRIHNGLIDGRYRWQAFNVRPADDYNDGERQAINDAMWNLAQVIPCVSFGIWPPGSNPSGDYVYIIKGTNNGCNSYIGRLGNRQDMNLQSPGCMSIGTIMHEMIHALGYHHEQCRPDRDNYVDIHWGNIQGGTEGNFERLDPGQWGTFGVPYNQQSIMHYGSHDFSHNGQPTITAKNGGPVGSTGQLQGTDIQRLKNMYGC